MGADPGASKERHAEIEKEGFRNKTMDGRFTFPWPNNGWHQFLRKGKSQSSPAWRPSKSKENK